MTNTECPPTNIFGDPLTWKFAVPFGTCIYNLSDKFSFFIGWISVLVWTVALLPQIIKTFKTKSVESVSLAFWLLWICGDICNFTGCILTKNLLTNTALAFVYLTLTFVAVIQYFYYHQIEKKRKKLQETIQNIKKSQTYAMATDKTQLIDKKQQKLAPMTTQDTKKIMYYGSIDSQIAAAAAQSQAQSSQVQQPAGSPITPLAPTTPTGRISRVMPSHSHSQSLDRARSSHSTLRAAPVATAAAATATEQKTDIKFVQGYTRTMSVDRGLNFHTQNGTNGLQGRCASPSLHEISPYLTAQTRNSLEFLHCTPRMMSLSPGSFAFGLDKKGNEELERIKARMLSPRNVGTSGGNMETLEHGMDSPHSVHSANAMGSRDNIIKFPVTRMVGKDQSGSSLVSVNSESNRSNKSINSNKSDSNKNNKNNNNNDSDNGKNGKNGKNGGQSGGSRIQKAVAGASLVTGSILTLMSFYDSENGMDSMDGAGGGSVMSMRRLLRTADVGKSGSVVASIVYFFQSNGLLIGRILGWLSAIIYISSRIPQLKMMIHTKDVSNLSPFLFVLTFFGNGAQCLSMLVRRALWYELNTVLSQLPWLLSSGLCMFQDAAIVLLIYSYQNASIDKSKNKDENIPEVMDTIDKLEKMDQMESMPLNDEAETKK